MPHSVPDRLATHQWPPAPAAADGSMGPLSYQMGSGIRAFSSGQVLFSLRLACESRRQSVGGKSEHSAATSYGVNVRSQAAQPQDARDGGFQLLCRPDPVPVRLRTGISHFAFGSVPALRRVPPIMPV